MANLNYDEILGAAADPVYSGLRRGLPGLMRYMRSGDRRIERAIGSVWAAPDCRYRAASYLAYELGQTVIMETPEPGPKLVAMIGLHGRALRTAAEVRLLVMNGFEAGASARWRSLHELTVTAFVIYEADALIAQRYLAYSDVERWLDLKEYQSKAERLNREPFGDDEVERARKAFDAVTETYGASMARSNGWAAPLFPSQAGPSKPRNIQFRELEVVSGLGHLRPFYKLGSHHVHAGARGAQLNMARSPDGRLLITTGATVSADFAEVFHGAAISLEQITAALVSACLEAAEDVQRPVELVVGMLAIQRFVHEIGVLSGRAHQTARDRGWVDHAE